MPIASPESSGTQLDTHNVMLLQGIREAGRLNCECALTTPQRAHTSVGFADRPKLIVVAHVALDRHGFCMAPVRFICGTQTLHRDLEQRIARYLGKHHATLYAACIDTNGGVFETLLDAGDAIISNSLNHASLIDGVSLCTASRYRFGNGDVNEFESCLQQADRAGAKLKPLVIDSVFSVDGYLADLVSIVSLVGRYKAQVMVGDYQQDFTMMQQGQYDKVVLAW